VTLAITSVTRSTVQRSVLKPLARASFIKAFLTRRTPAAVSWDGRPEVPTFRRPLLPDSCQS
jgi:hypothetical protein